MTAIDSGPSALAPVTATGHGADVGFDRNGLEVLDLDTCLELLGQATLGRIAVTIGALPSILPINFRMVGREIVFRTGVGTKLDAATANAVVAFEVDDLDPVEHTGWSVVVTGIAREVVENDRLARLDSTTIPRWAPQRDSRVVAIAPQIVTGRRIVHEAA
jgi:nitroimidazol reductase NimA-like FMN-containing flavoprotein (pyridoxamine 5'-phosphate oxidase superfamily)